jgi:HEAT repeat protein
LQAALTAGTNPTHAQIDALIERCAIEPDFYVRDMLTWALIHHEQDTVLSRILPELRSEVPQARSQALHTLSKIGDPETWPAITTDLLHDSNDEVARTAWRAAAGLVPEGQEVALAEELSSQFARGDREMQVSLSRAFAVLGATVVPVVDRMQTHDDENVRMHAIATERFMNDPEEGFDAAIDEARRTVTPRATPAGQE